MFTLGFPPVPFSITNVNVDKRYAKDPSNPFSLLEFVKAVANLVESNNITSYYNHYLTTWNSFKSKSASTSDTLIVEGYRGFVKDLTLNYNSVAENKFLSTIDYSDPYDLDVATKFIAAKIKSIADYYRDKREDVKLEPIRKKYKASNKGFITSIKEKIVEFLTNSVDRTVITNIDEISKKLTVNIDPLYDAESGYFNKQPSQEVYGRYDRDYNEDIFLKSNSDLILKVFAGMSSTDQSLQEVDDVFNNKRELTKKYMGTDYFYISATPVISNVPTLSVVTNTNIRYNTEFIKILTTVPVPPPPGGGGGGSTTEPPLTLPPDTSAPPTTAPPTTAPPTTDNYSCVNFNCLKRKSGEFKTKDECLKSCKKPELPPPDGGGGGGPGGGGGKKPVRPPNPPQVICNCKNIIFSSTGPYLKDPDSYNATLNDTKNCIQPDAWVDYEVRDNITWVCSNSAYEIRNFERRAGPGGPGIEYTPNSARTGGLWTIPHRLDCRVNVNTASRYYLDIINKQTGVMYKCNFGPGDEDITYSGPPYADFLLKKLTCCPTLTSDPVTPPTGPDTPPTSTEAPPTSPDTTTGDCPECEGPPTEPSGPPTEPPVPPSTSETTCPPCSDGGNGVDSDKRGKPKNQTVKDPSNSTTTSTPATTSTPVTTSNPGSTTNVPSLS
jgi:hypothetical protein